MTMSVAEFDWFVGIDWGTAHHVVQMSDASGTPVRDWRVEHSTAGLERLLAQVLEVSGGPLERVAVGIETPRGALVDLLVERGAAVFAVNPKQLDRFRDRFSVAGAKDDRLDALVLCSAVRTDRPRFRRVALDAPVVIRIRELTRARDVLEEEFLALTNRLRELVHRIAPQWLALSANADDVWFWQLLTLAATPTLGRELRRGKLERLLQTYRIRRVSVDAVLDALHTPPVPVAPGTVEAVTAHIALLVPRVALVHDQRQACERALAAALDALTPPPSPSLDDSGQAPPPSAATATTATPADPGDVAIIRSLPGVGVVVTSGLLANAGPLLAWRDAASLRAAMGVAPVRRQTGKQTRGTVSMRYACNQRLRNIAYYWAFASTRFDAAARDYYAALRARGHSHGRALRSVADRWIRILMAMLRTRTLYDPTHFARAVAGETSLAPA
jgi:transposase